MTAIIRFRFRTSEFCAVFRTPDVDSGQPSLLDMWCVLRARFVATFEFLLWIIDYWFASAYIWNRPFHLYAHFDENTSSQLVLRGVSTHRVLDVSPRVDLEAL